MQHVARLSPLLLALAVAGAASAQERPPTNPFLSAPIYGMTHFDPAQTDTVPYPVKRGEFRVDSEKAPRIAAGPVNIMNLSSTRPGFMWAISTERVTYVDAREGRWQGVAEIGLPGITLKSKADLDALLGGTYADIADVERRAKAVLGPAPQNVTTSGLYTVADKDDVVYVNAGTVICAIGLKDPTRPEAGLEIKRTLDTATVFPAFELPGYGKAVRLIGMSMTYDGHLVIGSYNAIAVVDRMFAKPAVLHTLEPDQLISNSFSVDEKNGIYVASGNLAPRGDGKLRKVVWNGARLSTEESDGGWISPYEGGDWPPAVKGGTGTGSTPTLMGFGPKNDERLVVLTDGVNRMKIVAFWRDAIPADFQQKPGTKSRRIAGQMPITAGLPPETPWVQSEQSVVVNGWGAFVVNNIVQGHPDKMIDVLAIGPILPAPRGMERVEWDVAKREWRSLWTRADVASTSMVPVASSASGMVFVNGYSRNEGWEVTGLDWASGTTVHRTLLGPSNLGNGAYALIQFTPEGDLLFNSVGGPLRVKLP
ncbi:MAG: hypothetical protein LCH39_01355 [Proteobacteria bacterium]|nr:hypothetical protein [Pseudomonadota bacterium]